MMAHLCAYIPLALFFSLPVAPATTGTATVHSKVKYKANTDKEISEKVLRTENHLTDFRLIGSLQFEEINSPYTCRGLHDTITEQYHTVQCTYEEIGSSLVLVYTVL